MKLVILLLVALAGVWLWQRGRRAGAARTAAARPGQRPALPMARCARCGMHVPASEAVAGLRGSYCCAGHRREAEGA
jgi:uncharacterized protein